ncbi:MAG: hypothetical protein ACHQF0_15245 [Chitinophagales bacterium]
MEKLKFTFRFIILLAALPVIMYTELTRNDKVNAESKQNTIEKTSAEKNEAATLNHFPLQAVYN